MQTLKFESSNNFNQLVELSSKLTHSEKLLLAKLLKKEAKVSKESSETHFASESTLSKDWLNEAEEIAWQNL